ncbi:MAG: type II secretion system F family protein, partial [Raoultibacter sp.]
MELIRIAGTLVLATFTAIAVAYTLQKRYLKSPTKVDVRNITPGTDKPGTKETLAQAGLRMPAGAWAASKTFFVLACAILGAAIGALTPNIMFGALVLSIIVAFGLLLPDAWLSSRVKRRIAKVEQQLPGAIDSLRIGVEAGKSIEDAMADYADTYPGVIATEFRNFRRDISLQKPRVEALLALGNRCGSQSAKSFCATIIQSELSGQEVAPILKAQASTIRVMRK